MSPMTLPHDSMRTVLAYNGLESKNGLVRTTYAGVFSIVKMLPLDCSSVPNHARTSGLSDVRLLTNSHSPDWIRSAHSLIMFSITVTSGPMKMACENGWKISGIHQTGQIR